MMTTESKLDCVFCNEIFEDKESLLIHFRKHGDPNFNTKPKNRLEELIPEKSTEDNEVISCDVCNEIFPTISKAITHKHKAHPDHEAKYFCPYCGKLFTMKHLYNKHIQSNHDSSEVTSHSKDFGCDSCKVIFHVPSAMFYHNKFFHRQDTEIPAVGQSKKVKMYNQEMIPIGYCAFCGEEFNNRVNLHTHICEDHSDENQSPTEVLRCPLCEAIFYHLDAYEIHLTFHSTEDLYSEQNELVASVTEFSLETVAPITEKVEEEEDTSNAAGIDSFLQLVMGENADNELPDKKSKKHKKHKKSKKPTITLDEFFNMNKDVFGDGLNVHGIEEVPSQVVLKKAKVKKVPNKHESKIVNADIAKLKKQGIVVKTNSGNTHVMSSPKKEVLKSKVVSNPNDILSKLMNQENSQIKIVKKSVVPQNYEKEEGSSTYDNLVNKNIDKELTPDQHEESAPRINSPIIENSPSNNENGGNDKKIADSEYEKEESIKSDSNKFLNIEENASEIQNQNIDLDNETNIHMDIEKMEAVDNGKNNSEERDSNPLIAVISSPDQSNLPQTSQYALKPSDKMRKDEKMSSEENIDEDNDSENVANKTLDALKHLSHLITVKSVTQGKPTNESKPIEQDSNEKNNYDNIEKEAGVVKQKMEQNIPKQIISKISENITVKPSKPSPSIKTFNSDFESEGEFNDEHDSSIHTDEETYVTKPLSRNIGEGKRINIKNFPTNQNKIPIKTEMNNDTDDEEEFHNNDFPKKSSNLDILKRLTNVTAKAINTTGINQRPIIQRCKPKVTQIKGFPKSSFKAGIDQEVEIFNIDDSDSDGNESNTSNTKIEEKPPNSPMTAVLQNLGKNVVVKSNKLNASPTNLKEKKEEPNVNNILQNKLKLLSGNVTVKPSSSSPNMFNKELNRDTDDGYDDEGNDSESESNAGKVKITEMQDDDISDGEFNDSHSNAIVESPHASNSENEDTHDDAADDYAESENKLKLNTFKRDTESPTPNKTCIENFKNFNKELTIKSLNSKKQDFEDEAKSLSVKEPVDDMLNLNRQIAIKQMKPNSAQNEPVNKSSQQQTGGPVNQASFNKKVSTSSNQVNTVKTVKRIQQSQTVIEEITTTVTKTIRTVNQSTNEVVHNRCATKPFIRPQKINSQPGRQIPTGTGVRFATPTVGTKIKNATIRNPNPNTIRPSNQLVPLRPTLNLARAGPSMSGVRKVAPPRSPLQKPPIGKLKISPNALNQATKRQNNEATGHFSSIKKSKECIVQNSDTTEDDDSAMQFSMTQSKSDFSSVSKTVKGKGTVTATQMRSEVNTCSQQQLNKLGNVSGLKIMKTSSKQVEEKCEVNMANKNTLEALEKLQKQGLLIKKPRLDDYNEQPNSYSESDEEAN